MRGRELTCFQVRVAPYIVNQGPDKPWGFCTSCTRSSAIGRWRGLKNDRFRIPRRVFVICGPCVGRCVGSWRIWHLSCLVQCVIFGKLHPVDQYRKLLPESFSTKIRRYKPTDSPSHKKEESRTKRQERSREYRPERQRRPRG